MRYLKSLIIAAFAFATAAGTLLAADDPLEIHGGGRVGVTLNSKLGAEDNDVLRGAAPSGWSSNELGSMPNYSESNYMSLSFSKKVTADGGAWSRVNFAFDDWRQYVGGDLSRFTLRLRAFNVEFGGLDFLPAGASLWAGLRGYGTGWNGQQDHAFINLAGIGFGIQNIGGLFSLAYMSQSYCDNDNHEVGQWDTGELKLGHKVAHNFIANVNVPVADLYGDFTYSKKPQGGKNYTAAYVAGIYHAPVYGINVGAAFATNGIARMMMPDNRSDTFIRGNYFGGTQADIDNSKYTGVSLSAWTVTDIAPGIYTATSIGYDMLKGGSKNTGFAGDNTVNWLNISSRWSKAMTKNIAVVGTVGFGREWDKEKTICPKAFQVVQITPSLEIGLDTGYWAGQKIQFYGTYTMVDKNHKFVGGAADGKKNKVTFGTLVTFGF